MLAFGVWTLLDDNKIGMKQGEKRGGSEHFRSGEDEGEKIGTGSGTGVDVAGHFTFHDGDTKGRDNLWGPRVKRGRGRGVDFQPTEGGPGQESGKGLAPLRDCGNHDLSYPKKGYHDEMDLMGKR